MPQFLAGAGWGSAEASPFAGDWSTRRYVRLRLGTRRAVLMDADGDASVPQFVAIAAWLRQQGLHAPELLAADLGGGLLLLEDLGEAVVGQIVGQAVAEQPIYELAVDVLLAWQSAVPPPWLPIMAEVNLLDLLDLFLDYATPEIASPVRARFRALWATVLPLAVEPQEFTFLHRDYHALNLTWLPGAIGLWRLGLLDFQDAHRGPPLYDLVSVLQDARRDVTPATVTAAIARWRAAQPRHDDERFAAAFAVLGAQRATRILGVVRRLQSTRDRTFPADLVGRVERHLVASLQHTRMAELAAWYHHHYAFLPASRG